MDDNQKPTLLSRSLVLIEVGELTALRITVAEDQEVIESYKQRAEVAEAEVAAVRVVLDDAGVEHSGLGIAARVKRLVENRDWNQKSRIAAVQGKQAAEARVTEIEGHLKGIIEAIVPVMEGLYKIGAINDEQLEAVRQWKEILNSPIEGQENAIQSVDNGDERE